MTPLFKKANRAMETCELFAFGLVDECCYCLLYDVTVEGYGKNERSGTPPKEFVPVSVTIKITAFKSDAPN
jgi:hypothetical protein